MRSTNEREKFTSGGISTRVQVERHKFRLIIKKEVAYAACSCGPRPWKSEISIEQIGQSENPHCASESPCLFHGGGSKDARRQCEGFGELALPREGAGIYPLGELLACSDSLPLR